MAQQVRSAARRQPQKAPSLLRRAERYETLAAIREGVEAYWAADQIESST